VLAYKLASKLSYWPGFEFITIALNPTTYWMPGLENKLQGI